MILCDATNPGMDGDVYHQPYQEGVEGFDHAYRAGHQGVQWTRVAMHPTDPHCPACAQMR